MPSPTGQGKQAAYHERSESRRLASSPPSHDLSQLHAAELSISVPSLLISVRDLLEFRLCLEAGVPWIDFKEPDDGALAPTSSQVWHGAAAVIESLRSDTDTDTVMDSASDTSRGLRPRLSAALGELRDLCRSESAADSTFSPDMLPSRGLDFVKLGWSGTRLPDAAAAWQAWARACAPRACPVLVIYADHATCQAPDPATAIEAVGDAPCGALLIDTFHKHQGDLFAHLTQTQINECLEQARNRGWFTVLAGSLRDAALDRAMELQPDVIAVRGAACRGDRRGSLDPQKIDKLLGQVLGSDHPSRRAMFGCP